MSWKKFYIVQWNLSDLGHAVGEKLWLNRQGVSLHSIKHRKWSKGHVNQWQIIQGNGLHKCRIRQVLLYNVEFLIIWDTCHFRYMYSKHWMAWCLFSKWVVTWLFQQWIFMYWITIKTHYSTVVLFLSLVKQSNPLIFWETFISYSHLAIYALV